MSMGGGLGIYAALESGYSMLESGADYVGSSVKNNVNKLGLGDIASETTEVRSRAVKRGSGQK